MGPIPGVSWADVFGVVPLLVSVTFLLGVQFAFAIAINTAYPRRIVDWSTVVVILPFLLIAANQIWLQLPGLVAVVALLLWVAGTAVLFRRAEVIRARAARTNQVEAQSSQADPIPDRPRPSTARPVLALLLLAAAVVTPEAIHAAVTHTPCESAEILLAHQRVDTVDAAPSEWMPASGVPGLALLDERATNLEDEAAARKDPKESRTELARDGFVDGYRQRWSGVASTVEFAAQRFATPAGAIAFQAFATRFACRYANETFAGPRGAIGLQIRFATGKPIGEQVSWVSGTTRIIVFEGFDAPPLDHVQVTTLMRLVSP